MLGQPARLRSGIGAIAGNYILISALDGMAVVGVMHLQAGSIRVAAGERVRQGQHLAACGNSGNSTQPHVHLQAMDAADPRTARGLPLVFRSFREKLPRGTTFVDRNNTLPAESSIVEAL